MRAWRIDKPQIREEPSTVVILPSAKEHDSSEDTLLHFGCSKQPFTDSYDPDLFFLSSLHLEAVTALIDAVACDRGLSAFMAGPGAGKTTLLYRLLECYSTAAHTAFLPRSCGSASGLKQALLGELQRMFKKDSGADRRVLIVLDEAHNFTSSELEVVRMLSAFESPTSKLLHFVLAGRPELADSLLRAPLINLKSRITVVNRDLRLPPVEIESYVNLRLKQSGYSGPPLFNPEAIREIAAASRGVPRQINAICARAMSRAWGLDVKEITGCIIRDISTEPTSHVPCLPFRQTAGSNSERWSEEEQRQPRPPIIASSKVQARGSLQRIRLPRIFQGSYKTGLAVGIGAVAVAVICLVVLYAWTFGLTSHPAAEVAVRTQIDNHQLEHQTVADLSVAKASRRASNSATESSPNLPVRGPMSSSNTSHPVNDQPISSRTATASDSEGPTIDRLADLQPVRRSVDTGDSGSETPPQLAVAATSDSEMTPLNFPDVSARVPISAPSGANGWVAKHVGSNISTGCEDG